MDIREAERLLDATSHAETAELAEDIDRRCAYCRRTCTDATCTISHNFNMDVVLHSSCVRRLEREVELAREQLRRNAAAIEATPRGTRGTRPKYRMGR